MNVSKADFTSKITPNTISITDTALGKHSVINDMEAVLRKIEYWRGPVWFPINFILIESLQKYHQYYGNDFKVECPSGSGNLMTLREVSQELSRRLVSLFTRRPDGTLPVYGALHF